MVIWCIGMSGSGKTTLTELLYAKLKPRLSNLVRLDGDVLRDVFAQDVDHSMAGREKNALRLSHLSKMLADQDIHVIAAVLSVFPEWQQWNRDHLRNYAQVYLKVPFETLVRRDVKNLYAPALRGEIDNVIGVDLPWTEPIPSDLEIDNSQDLESYDLLVDQILTLPVVQRTLHP